LVIGLAAAGVVLLRGNFFPLASDQRWKERIQKNFYLVQ
jgi:hypothetical protein